MQLFHIALERGGVDIHAMIWYIMLYYVVPADHNIPPVPPPLLAQGYDLDSLLRLLVLKVRLCLLLLLIVVVAMGLGI